jgi:hypothetical protein
MNNLIHLVVSTVWNPSFFVGMAASSLLARFLIRPLGVRWDRLRVGKQRLLERDSQARWLSNGGHRVTLCWRDHARAWWRCLTWRWSNEGKELRAMWRNVPLPPPDLRGCEF